MTEQHGGGYSVTCDAYKKEAFLNDVFYGWGNWVSDVTDSNKNFEIGPSYRNHLLYDCKVKSKKYILWLGTCIIYYKIGIESYFAGTDKIHEYINAVVAFFKAVDEKSLKSILVRNYWLDFGYHLDQILRDEIPNINIQGYLQKDYNENANFVARNNSFQKTLLDCSLIIVDEVATGFLEALYCEKPFIVLFNKLGYPLRNEEIPYFKMMEDTGLFFYDWNKAAALVNKIHDDIDSWWNDAERQRVVKIVKQRYSCSVPDPKKWWFKEFMSQIKLCETSRKCKK